MERTCSSYGKNDAIYLQTFCPEQVEKDNCLENWLHPELAGKIDTEIEMLVKYVE